jgi:hypothetical protein
VRLVEILALRLQTTLAQAQTEGREAEALLELLDRLGAKITNPYRPAKRGRTFLPPGEKSS